MRDLLSNVTKKVNKCDRLTTTEYNVWLISEKLRQKYTKVSVNEVKTENSLENVNSMNTDTQMNTQVRAPSRQLFQDEIPLPIAPIDLTRSEIDTVPRKVKIIEKLKSTPTRKYASENDQMNKALDMQQETIDAVNRMKEKIDELNQLQMKKIEQNGEIIDLLKSIASSVGERKTS